VLTLALLPYAWLGLSDTAFHVRRRPVAWPERLAHAALFVALLTVIPQAYLGRRAPVVIGLVLFAAARGVDEFYFHRRLPAEESALHARTHLAFLAFVVAVMGVDWLEGSRSGIEK
jgi:hypothetical protein